MATGCKLLSCSGAWIHGFVHSHIQHNPHPCTKTFLRAHDCLCVVLSSGFGSASLQHCHMRGVLAWTRVGPQPPTRELLSGPSFIPVGYPSSAPGSSSTIWCLLSQERRARFGSSVQRSCCADFLALVCLYQRLLNFFNGWVV